jgi:hypothetical protein
MGDSPLDADLEAGTDYLFEYRALSAQKQQRLVLHEAFIAILTAEEQRMNSRTMEIAPTTSAKRWPRAIEFPDMGLAPTAGAPAGELVLLRGDASTERLLWPYLYCDGVPVAHTADETYFSVRLTPGPHALRTDSTAKPFLLEVKAGGRHYLRLKTARKGIAPRQELEQLAAEDATPLMEALEPLPAVRISLTYR